MTEAQRDLSLALARRVRPDLERRRVAARKRELGSKFTCGLMEHRPRSGCAD